MSYVATLHLYSIKLGAKLIRSLHPLWLGQGRSLYKGGGGVLGGMRANTVVQAQQRGEAILARRADRLGPLQGRGRSALAVPLHVAPHTNDSRACVGRHEGAT